MTNQNVSHPNPPSENVCASARPGMVLRRQLLQCMAETLTPRQYQAFVLNFLEGMPQNEIASEMGVSQSTVSRHCQAARVRLRQSLGYELEEPTEDWESDTAIFPEQPYPVRLPGFVVPEMRC